MTYLFAQKLDLPGTARGSNNNSVQKYAWANGISA